MNRFPDPAQLASWAGLCPGNERGGKRLFGTRRTRYLRRVLVQSAWSVFDSSIRKALPDRDAVSSSCCATRREEGGNGASYSHGVTEVRRGLRSPEASRQAASAFGRAWQILLREPSSATTLRRQGRAQSPGRGERAPPATGPDISSWFSATCAPSSAE